MEKELLIFDEYHNCFWMCFDGWEIKNQNKEIEFKDCVKIPIERNIKVDTNSSYCVSFYINNDIKENNIPTRYRAYQFKNFIRKNFQKNS